MKTLFLSKSVWILFSTLFLGLNALIYQFTGTNPDLIKFLLELSFIIIVFSSIYYFKFLTKSAFSIHTLFISLFVFFLGTRVFLDFINYDEIEKLTFYREYTLSSATTCQMILNLNIALLAYLIGVILFSLWKPEYDYKIRPHNSIYVNNNIIDYLFFAGILIKIVFSVQLFLQLRDKGYLALFLGEIQVDKNIIQWLFESFSLVGLIVYFIGKRKITWWIYSGAFLYSMLSLATGQRGMGLIFLLFSFFYLKETNKIKVTGTKALSFGALLYSLSVLVEIIRRGGEIDIWVLIDGVPNFLWHRGVSVSLLAYAIDFKDVLRFNFIDMFGNVKYLVDYYSIKFTGGQQPVDMMKENALTYKIYGSYISHITNTTMYKLGFAMGGSYVAQLFSLGKEYLQLIGGIFTGFFISFMYKFLTSDRFLLKFIGFNFLLSLVYIPRDNMFDFLTENWIVYIAALLYMFIIKIFYLKDKALESKLIA